MTPQTCEWLPEALLVVILLLAVGTGAGLGFLYGRLLASREEEARSRWLRSLREQERRERAAGRDG